MLDYPAADPGVAWVRAMQAGDLPAAWRIGDAVLAARNPATRDDPRLPYHERWVWDGTPPDGREVLVRCYHGLGDTLQFARFLPALRARAARVTLECQPALCPLLADWPCIDRLVAFDPAHPLPAGACDVEIMELGHVLRAETAGLGALVPYLHVPTDRLARVRTRAAGAVGLCWQAGGWDPSRSVTLEAMLALPEVTGRHLLSLQRGPAAAEADGRFINPGDADEDVVETAALACSAAHVVTVDTMVAHLAGALGCPATVLVKREPDWRWPADGRRSVWYPTVDVRQAV